VARRLAADGFVVVGWDSRVDVRDPLAIKKALASVSLMGIDVLVNNAGIFGPVGAPLTYDRAAWDDVLAVNLTGQLNVAQAVIPGMVERGYGRVINMSSVVVKDANPNVIAYTVSKAGVEAMTRCLALATAKTGVTVNCVRPAAVNTDLFKSVPKEQVDAMLLKCPMNRFIEADEVASLVAFLASAEASGMTGAAFDVAGGRCQL
jgi:NAD(P)-dependent dehydrogenase (short-subunit alcohol dehydrogenase family)